ncbi:family 16 glycosylhydrolase [Parasediminibacterium sp. JCM 36343]|uniref:family 16 glycosylhydrolase n=1 Tax=Parasediminibacterium sp. JCM 36343 TaxID=3374279 RepID=UPI00397D26B6
MKILNSNLMILLVSILLLIGGCKKDDATSTAPILPANLVVYANVTNDSTGNVTFNASADNAVSYKYYFGNGDSAVVASGNANYQYTTAGANLYTVTVIATSSTGQAIQKTVQVNVTVRNGSEKVVWSDEFNTDGAPDSSKWGYDLGGGGWGNSELEYYTNSSSNASVQNGYLKITAIKQSFNGSAYTSARLLTKNKFKTTYGRVEVRAKLPSALGTWPAIWMLGSNIDVVPWPGCGEIDIMEQKGNELNKIYGTLHYPGHSGGGGVGTTTTIANSSTDFHVYSLDWSPSTLKLYVDKQLFFSFANNGTTPFNKDFFFILNLAMGGTFGGTVDPNFTSDAMLVDYIRVYK